LQQVFCGPREGKRPQIRIGHASFASDQLQRRFRTEQLALVWLTSGAGTLSERGHTHHLESGMVFMRPIGRPHDISIRAGTSWYFVALPSSMLAVLGQLRHPLRRCWHLGQRLELIQRFHRCMQDFRDLDQTALLPRFAIAVELFAELLDGDRQQPTSRDRHAGAVQRAMNIVREDLQRHWNLDELAAELGLDAQVFRKAFTRVAGVAAQQWMIQQRLDRACRLLTDRERRIGDIAQAIGYADAMQLSTLFKRHLGCSPSVWRANLVETLEDEAF